MSDPRYAFVLGTGRCGSTLVHEVLARHPAMGFLTNVEDRFPLPAAAGRFNNALYRTVPARFTQKGRVRFAPSEGYRALERSVSPILSTPQRDLRAEDVTPWLERRTRRFFASRAEAQGLPVFLHKFTGWPRAGFLARIFPEARFVHVVRDGRAVANSFLQMPWWRGYEGPAAWGWGPLPDDYAEEWAASDRSFALLAGIEWKLLVDAFEEAKAGIDGDRWYELRYEDFVAAPREETMRLLGFLDLAWTPAFEDGFARYTFETGRTDAYRTDLGIRDVAALDASLAGHLERLGYPSRGGDRPAVPPAEGGRS
jgi:sulfotransferase family protein